MEARPYAANRIVGRDGELQRLADVLGAGDSARVALVGGEAGIGKTRLVRDALASSSPSGALVITLRGDATRRSKPFDAFTAAVEAHVRDWTSVPPALEPRRPRGVSPARGRDAGARNRLRRRRRGRDRRFARTGGDRCAAPSRSRPRAGRGVRRRPPLDRFGDDRCRPPPRARRAGARRCRRHRHLPARRASVTIAAVGAAQRRRTTPGRTQHPPRSAGSRRGGRLRGPGPRRQRAVPRGQGAAPPQWGQSLLPRGVDRLVR